MFQLRIGSGTELRSFIDRHNKIILAMTITIYYLLFLLGYITYTPHKIVYCHPTFNYILFSYLSFFRFTSRAHPTVIYLNEHFIKPFMISL